MSVPKTVGSVARTAQSHAGQAAQDAKPWVEHLARLGYRAKGVIYAVIGWLALLAALGQGGKTTSAGGALATIAVQPFGRVLLIAVAVGLVGYALWRFVQGIADPQHKGSDAKGIAKRVGYLISGVGYSGLALTAAALLQGARVKVEGGGTQDATARLLALPLGRFLVMAVGLVLIGIGLNTLYTGIREKFRETLRWSEMREREQRWATISGKIGYTARAIVLALIGSFLILAGMTANPNDARGLDGALKVLAQQSYGPVLLGTVAAGLVAYGAYSFFVEARYRRVFER